MASYEMQTKAPCRKCGTMTKGHPLCLACEMEALWSPKKEAP